MEETKKKAKIYSIRDMDIKEKDFAEATIENR